MAKNEKNRDETMQVALLWATVIVSAVTFLVHTFIGGPRVAAPLLENDTLPIASKWLNYYCWHITTIYTFMMGGAYAYMALYQENLALLVFLSILNVSFAILSAAVAIKGKINPFRFPSTSLFATVALLGILSLSLGRSI
jgi:hypothetical protein